MEIFIFPLAALVIFLILTEFITVRFINCPSREIHLDFTIIGIRFIRQKETERGGYEKKKISLLKKIISTNKSTRFLLRGSEISIERFNVYKKSSSPNIAAIERGAIYISAGSILNLLKNTSKKLTVNNINVYLTDNNKTITEYDFKISFSLVRGLMAAVIFLFNLLFTKVGKKKNVGRKNE